MRRLLLAILLVCALPIGAQIIGSTTDITINNVGGGGGGDFLAWTAASGATGYKVYGNLNFDGPPYESSTDVGNVTSVARATLTWVTSGTWYFNIRSYDESGLEGPWGDQIEVVVP